VGSFWYHVFQADKAFRELPVLESLQKVGVSRQFCDGAAGPGVVLVGEVTDQVYKFLSDVSDRGRKRILVLVPNSSVLKNGEVWRLLQGGASDVMAWDRLPSPAHDIAERLRRWQAVEDVLCSALVKENLVGSSLAWTRVLRQCIEAAKFTDSSVLITGESGTGKELLARLIHTLDSRSDKRNLVVLDCTTVVPELSGSEFFGHERGAFTGAVSSRDGAFALADGGTLFLDELGDLPLGLQAQLLRVIQEHVYKRVGGNEWLKTNFRLVCATNRDFSGALSSGNFRSDLYYRVAVCIIEVPPLRERPEDILPLISHSLRRHSPNPDPPELSDEVRDLLCGREYPGNVRELKQMVTRIAYCHVGSGPVTVGDVPEDKRPQLQSNENHRCDRHFEDAIRRALEKGVGLKEIGSVAEQIAVDLAISEANGNLQRAAERLGVTGRALQLRRAAKNQIAS
jgi:transcriptional regulator with GAF, ATPase, and Fis domain